MGRPKPLDRSGFKREQQVAISDIKSSPRNYIVLSYKTKKEKGRCKTKVTKYFKTMVRVDSQHCVGCQDTGVMEVFLFQTLAYGGSNIYFIKRCDEKLNYFRILL